MFFFIALLLQTHNAHAAVDRQTLKWLNKRPLIDSIVINGNNAFSRSRILEQLYSRKNSFLRGIRNERRRRIERETLNRDTLEIKYLYLVNGYLGIRVQEDFEVIEPDSTALVKVNIKEGRQFRYGEVTLSGDITEKERKRFGRYIRQLRFNKPVNPFTLQDIAFRMKEDLANQGHPYALVSVLPDTNLAGNLSPVAIRISRDSLVHFGEVQIEGTDKFPRKVVERELMFESGDTYKRDDILMTQRMLYATGNFSSVQIEPLATSPRQSPTMRVRVRERKPRFATFRTGAGQSEFRAIQWDIEGQAGQRNFFGYRKYDLTARYSFGFGASEKSRLLTHEYILRYTEPRPFNLRLPLSTSVTWQPPLADEVLDLKLETWRLTFETRRRNLGKWN